MWMAIDGTNNYVLVLFGNIYNFNENRFKAFHNITSLINMRSRFV